MPCSHRTLPPCDATQFERDAARRFAETLAAPERPTPSGLVGPDGTRADKRFDVYRNNVVVGLVDALVATFPAVQRIVGERFFRAAARVHALASPPTSPLMTEYGRDFAEFLRRFEPTKAFPYLPDVARIERAWLDAYHAADAPPLSAETMGSIEPRALVGLRLVRHPAASVVRSRFAAVSATAMNRSDGPVTPIDVAVPEDGLIVRPDLEVRLVTLPPGGGAFLHALFDGAPLGAAAERALAEEPTFDLAANVAGAIASGAFCDVRSADTEGVEPT